MKNKYRGLIEKLKEKQRELEQRIEELEEEKEDLENDRSTMLKINVKDDIIPFFEKNSYVLNELNQKDFIDLLQLVVDSRSISKTKFKYIVDNELYLKDF